MEPELVLASSPLDFELAQLLGVEPGDFLILCFDGVQFKGFGTPFDTPQNRKDRQALVDGLNDRTTKSWWPELWVNWSADLKAQYGLAELAGAPDDQRPTASIKVSRVCAGYSSYLHCAIRLFEHERVSALVSHWAVGVGADGEYYVKITNRDDRHFDEVGQSLSLVIGLAVKRLLIADGMSNAQVSNEPNKQS